MNRQQFQRRLKHRVTWRKKSGGSDSQGLSFGSGVKIHAFRREATTTTTGPGGAEVRSFDNVWVSAATNVSIGDLIDGQVVEARESIEDARRGERVGYKLGLEPSSG